jgi:perosamine synthetase
MPNNMIPIYKPDLSGNEKKYVLDCLDSTWISSKGEYIRRFEEEFANSIGVKFAVGVCNGTVALHLALLALGIGPGDEVIVPTLTYISAVNAIVYVGAKPVFCDSRPDTWQMDEADVELKITNRTRALICVHLYGHPCNMDALREIAIKFNLVIIEDCAEAIGSKYKGEHVGTFGDIATFSFFGNKTITTGEGGMVVSNDATLASRVNHFKGQGLAMHREYWHDVVGYNYRMTNICAAIGLAQLETIKPRLSRKREIAMQYSEAFQSGPVIFHAESKDVYHSYWMCSILVEGLDRDRLREHLKVCGIETRPLFYPVHTMPMYAEHFQPFKVAEDLGWRGINLPSYPSLTNEQVKFIIDKVFKFYE